MQPRKINPRTMKYREIGPYEIRLSIDDAVKKLDPIYQHGKVRSFKDMTPEEVQQLKQLYLTPIKK